MNEYKVEIYVPEDYVEEMRRQLNAIGVLKVGDYDNVVSITKVTGYWRPLENAKPFSGKIGDLHYGSECKMELRCNSVLIKEALKKIHEIHPYEEPVVNVLPLMNINW